MRLPERPLFIAGIVIFCAFCFMFLQAWFEMVLGSLQQPGAVGLDVDHPRTPMLGLVVPLSVEEIASAMDSLERWPTSCSRTTSNNVDLILYFARELPQELESHLRLAKDSTSCFRRTRVVTAALNPEENTDNIVRSAQFYKLFLSTDVRAKFVDYDALAFMEWDTIVAQDRSFERLYSTAFSGNEPFWVKGSRLAGADFDENAASPETQHFFDHLDGHNAIYNNTDNDFVELVNSTLDRWQLTRPFDVALWTMISDFPYSWPLWQRYGLKFVATSMVATIDAAAMDESDKMATNDIAPEALFFRRRVKGIGTRPTTVARQSFGCFEACGSSESSVEFGGVVSTVCDSTCVESYPGMGVRFNGQNCGAGDPSKYGKSCRMCYEDHDAALNADQALATSTENSWTTDDHVIMCATKRPPEAIDCPRECLDNMYTVCDSRCGNGRYSDWHCNWRNLGEKCRLCFRDITEARRADKVAKEAGGRVIMCETHEPPPERHDMETVVTIGKLNHDVGLGGEESSFEGRTGSEEAPPNLNPSEIPFIGDVMRGHICVFIPGYFEFFHETKIAVDTIMEFMPGVRVAIATHPMDYHVYNRAVGEPNVAVSIVNNTRVDYAPLAADKACGNETRLIYYMGLGEVLSRPFTAEDTHSRKGDVLVKHTDAELAGGEHARRSMGTTVLLGFHGLSFTYGTDLFLPADMNAHLRAVLRDAMDGYDLTRNTAVCEQEDSATCPFHEFLNLVSSKNMAHASIFIPELLAALLYERNPEGVQFLESSNQGHRSLPGSTIWDAPPVKPRFGCSIDLSLTLQGYDVADQLDKHVEAFRHGARCDHGFVPVDPTTLKLKAGWEFPKGFPSSSMPSLRDFRISVMYRTFSGDLEIFNMTLPTAIKHIPDALELVVVVEEGDKDVFEELLAPHRKSAPFPLRLVTEPSLMDGHIQQKYSKMRADLYTEGDYVLHLDSDVLVLHDISYDEIFHLGKPVLPYRRHRDDSPAGKALISCWKNATSNAVGEDVLHEFSIFNTHVYPRQMYKALREFLEERHGRSFTDYMSSRVGRCQSPHKWAAEKRNRLLSDFNLMGAFLWYHMHEAVYWIPADPYDLHPEQFRVDLLKFNWVCQANGRFLPADAAGKEQFKKDFLAVTNTPECGSVVFRYEGKLG